MENTEKTIDDINEEINQEIQKTKGKDSEVELEITENTEEKPKEVDKDTLSEEDKKQYSINVQNRIKKLISEKNKSQEETAQLQSKLDAMAKRLEKIEVKNEKQGQEAIQEHYNLTKKALAKAIEEGDTEAQIKFNEELVDLKTSLALQRMEKASRQNAVSPTVGKAQQVATNPTPPLAQQWWKENNWFNAKGFEQETALARAIDVQLDIEGFDKNSPDYYRELNSRLQKRFPEIISGESVTTKPRANSRQAVAPTTGGSVYKGNRIKVSKDELAMARELGITDPEALKKYAKEIQSVKTRRDN
tara:strand:- start:150 stop:1061 length:912 start_codon:yes stop_codon:yes gene_type:complete